MHAAKFFERKREIGRNIIKKSFMNYDWSLNLGVA
jgi:hypothetical protein